MTGPADSDRPTRRRVLQTGGTVLGLLIGGVGAVGAATSNGQLDHSGDCDADSSDECPISVTHPTNVGTVESVREHEENGNVEIKRQPMTAGGHIR